MSGSGRWLVGAAGVLLAACVGRSYPLAAAPPPASSVVVAAVAQDLPEGAGKEIVERLCSGCHDLMFTMSTREDEEGWARIVDDMRSRGTDGTEEEFDAVIAYLAAHMGPAGQAAAPAAHATLQILASRTKVTPGERFLLGLSLAAADGWHLNAEAAPDTLPQVTWEAPLLAVDEPVRSAGHASPAFTVFPATVATSAEPGATIAITAQVTYDVCQETCQTTTSTVSLQLPVGDGGEPDHADAFAIPR